MAGPFNWEKYFPRPQKNTLAQRLHGRWFLLPEVIAYNPSLVPTERVPRKWDDCLHPYWKGKFAMDVVLLALVSLYPAWGEQRILQFAKRIKEAIQLAARHHQGLNHDCGGRVRDGLRHLLRFGR